MFEDDLDIFFNLYEFAMEASMQGRSIAGYLSNAYPTLHAQDDPVGHFHFLCAAKDIIFLSSGDLVVIGKNRYQLIGMQRDEIGFATLTLLLIEKVHASKNPI